jgi:hypothetical protein
MVAIPLLSGVAATEQAENIQTYPLNLEPVAINSNISRGQLRPTSGSIALGTGPGVDRGGITWNDQHFRVMGTKLVRIDASNTLTIIGDVGGEGPARLDYSFDRLGIRSGTALWLYDLTTLAQVTDADLGAVVDAMWIAGYWMSTDGTSVVVTELTDPFQILPLKYGSAEEDPDKVTGLIKARGEAYVLNRHTIQVFRNVGGSGFPFQTIPGATIPVGCIGADAKCLFAGSFAFVGSARNEALGVYVAGQGSAAKISTRTIDDALRDVEDCGCVHLEARTYRDEERLFVHLPTESWVYLKSASQTVGQPVWYRARSGTGQPYRVRNAVLAYGRAYVGDHASSGFGLLSEDVSSHFGDKVEWGFDAGLVYNEGKGALVHSIELIGLPGRIPPEDEATVFLSMTRDGQTFSVERAISMGRAGDRRKRLQWRPHSRFTNYLGLRFRGYNRAMPGFAKIEADLRPLAA